MKKNYLLLLLLLTLLAIGGANGQSFVTTWKTDNPGTSEDDEITIPTNGSGYDYSVDWGDGNTDMNVTGDVTHTYASAGTYTVSISGDFPRIYFNNGGDREKLLTIESWGAIAWTNMEGAFHGCINMDINATDAPDLSSVTSLQNMFNGASTLNADIDHWDVSTVTSLHNTFSGATSFNQGLNSWNVSNVNNMNGTFAQASFFNGNISSWNVSNVTTMLGLFYRCFDFNQDISGWNVSSVTDMTSILRAATSFNQDIGGWDVSSVTKFRLSFDGADVFNQDISGWNVGSVTDFSYMFREAEVFNQPIGSWDVSAATTMEEMFQNADAFNQDLNSWDVSNVTDMSFMFRLTNSFNGDITNWNVSNVTDMTYMFENTQSFNQPIGSWDVGNVTSFYQTFSNAHAFDQDVTSWDVSSGTDFFGMFFGVDQFDQDLSGWDVSSATNMDQMFHGSGLSKSNYDKTLIGWSQLTLQSNVTLGADDIEYCNGAAERQSIIDNFTWTIEDAGEVCNSFITTWKTDNPGTSEDNEITIPTEGSGYNYTVDWGDGNTDMNVTGDVTHTYASAGTYTVSISGDFPRIFFNGEGDREKIISIEQWGDITWESMVRAFQGCSNLTYNATDVPDLSNVTSLQLIFSYTDFFNADLSGWDVGTVTNMNSAFYDAVSFNGDVSTWDVSNVTNFAGMFRFTSFNQDVSNWDISSATSLGLMFADNPAFNQDIGAWNTTNVTTISDMFNQSPGFNQDIGNWDVGSVTNFRGVFVGATSFNQDVGDWNVASATNMSNMFLGATSFDQNLGDWNIINVTDASQMFNNSGLSKVNYDNILAGWSLLTLQDDVPLGASGIDYCHASAARQSIIDNFNWSIDDGNEDCQAFITTWKTDNSGTSNDDQITIPTTGSGYDYSVDWGDGNTDMNVTGDITHTYATAGTYTVSITGDFPRIYFNFGGDASKILTIEQWGDIEWSSMQRAFGGCANLTSNATDAPNLTSVTSLERCFTNCSSFNGSVGNWNTSNVEVMWNLFFGASSFNQDISGWSTDNVTNMQAMFRGATSFNQDISSWNTANVTIMNFMFYDASAFNQDISGWNTSSADFMNSMFDGATSFNQDIGGWDVSAATRMDDMFLGASSFNQDLSNWDVSNVTQMPQMFNGSGLSKANYDKLLEGWSQLTLQSNVVFGASGVEYCHGAAARQSIIDNFSWTITDGGENCAAFVTTWKTDNTGTSADNEITIPTDGSGYDYTVDWGDGNSDMNVTGDITHTYASSGTYTVSISGDFPRIYFNNGGDEAKILSIEQWGDIQWSSMEFAFAGCENLQINANDAPNLENVTSLRYMFNNASSVNSDLNNWDVSNVTNLFATFAGATSFNGNISDWDVSNVNTMVYMFGSASAFNQDIGSWNVSNVTNMKDLFFNARAFNHDIGDWDVSNVTNMVDMFFGAWDFNQDIGDWDITGVSDMNGIFEGATSFNQDLSGWNTSGVTNMRDLFKNATAFNQSVDSWDVSNVADMTGMFWAATAYNQSMDSWNIASTTDLSNMFRAASSFNQDINWDMSSMTNLTAMFFGASSFNGDISDWDVSSVTNMTSLFNQASAFNQDISSWDVSSVTTMSSMFSTASAFNQNLAGWDVSNVADATNMFVSTSLSKSNYDKLLIGWSALTLQDDVPFRTSSSYCHGATARQSIIDNFNWDFTDGGENCQAFVTTWKTDNSGTSNDDQITIPTTGAGYDYSIDWGDGNSDNNVTGDITHTYASAGTYTVSISGEFPRIYFNDGGDGQKLLTVEQWGDVRWTSMENAFYGCTNMTIPATDAPDLSGVTSMQLMLGRAESFNESINHWDVSNVTNIRSLFFDAAIFNQPLDQWDVSNVTTMNGLFSRTDAFNQDLTSWDVSSVVNMETMFFRATAFNADISNWDVSNVVTIRWMFFNANLFNSDIEGWDVSSLVNMERAFTSSSFDQDLSDWDVSNVTDLSNTFSSTNLSRGNYDKLLDSWSQLTLQNNVTFGATGVEYCLGATARQSVIDNFSWTITDDGENCIVNIPDANFKAALLANTSINTVDDGEISVQEADAFTGTVDVNNQGINDLTGIEAFANIPTLWAWSNNLNSVDLRANTELTQLILNGNNLGTIDLTKNSKLINLQLMSCGLTSGVDLSNLTSLAVLVLGDNGFSSLDLSSATLLADLRLQNTNLTSLDLYANTAITQLRLSGSPITALDVSGMTGLHTFYFDNSVVTELDLSHNGNLVTLSIINNDALNSIDLRNSNNGDLANFSVRNTASLSCISVDDVAFARTNWTDVDDIDVFKFTCDPNDVVHIPDANFKAALLANTSINTTDDGEITYGEAEAFTGILDAINQGITDATGLEAFINVTEVTLRDNSISSIDVRSNIALTDLNLRNNDLTSLDITHNTQLEYLEMEINDLTSLDVSNNTLLTDLLLQSNDLSALDVSNNTALRLLRVHNNNITSLDLTNNSALNFLLITNNPITSIDVSNNPNLGSFWAQNGQFSTLDFSNNTSLSSLWLENCDNLTELDVSNNPLTSMFRIDGSDNLTEVDVRNGNNANMSNFLSGSTPNLTCILVDNVAYANANWTSIDAANEFKLSCDPNEAINFPDANFKAVLLADASLNTTDDGEITVAEAEAFSGTIDGSSGSIFDATGIQYFPNITTLNLIDNSIAAIDVSENLALTNLFLYNNDITSLNVENLTALSDMKVYGNDLSILDVSNNTNLSTLWVHDNNLSTLDVTANTALVSFRIGNNPISSIDLSNNASLGIFNASGCNLSSIDLSNNTALHNLEIASNDLNTIDLSANTALQIVNVSGNNLTALDVSNNTSVTLLWATFNNLSTLDASGLTSLNNLLVNDNMLSGLNVANGNNSNFTRFEANNNADLHCITVDDVSYSETNWTVIDAHTGFSLNCFTDTDIIGLTLSEQTNDATIDDINHTVDIEVVFGTDVTALTPTITLLEPAGSISPTGAQDFTSPVTYTVTAEDGSTTQDWEVTVTIAPNTATDITAFSLAEQTGSATIDDVNHTVEIEVMYQTDLTSLTPTISVSANGSIVPNSGVVQDFSTAITYTVTAEDGATTQDWMVTVTEAPSNETDILSFVLSEQTGTAVIDDANHTIDIEVAYTTDLSNLTPTITVSNGASIDPASGAAQDFASSVTYTVTAADGTTQDWIVTVTEAPSNETDILSFVLAEQTGAATIDASVHTVDIEVAYTTDLSNLTPTITVSDGALIDPASGVAQDFISSVTYTVTAADGTTQDWTVTITEAPSNETDILTFVLAEQTGAATIDASNHTVDIEVAYTTDLSNLTPTITVSNGASIDPASGAAQDFTSSVTYTVTADDGTTQDWTVTITEAPSNETDILTFVLAEQTGAATVDAANHTVDIEVAYTTDLSNLTPTITVSDGASIDPASEVAQDFTSSVTYTVTAADGTTQDWTVTITEAPSNETDILTFVLAEQTGAATIDASVHTVDIEVAYTTDLSSLTPTITVSDGASIDPVSGAARDFTSSVTYTVTAADGTTQDWTVTVNEAPSNETDILTFVLAEQTGAATIDASVHTVDIEVAYTTNLSSLTPTITVSDGASIDPVSGAAQDFTSSVTYTVTAADGTTQDWTVTVNEAPSNETDILTFVLAEQTGTATIDASNHTVDIEVAYTTDLSNLTPTITVSDGASIDPASGVAQDFASSVIYTVTAVDGATQDWTVTVTEAPSNETDILTFVLAEQTGDATIDATAHTVDIEVTANSGLSNLTPTITVSDGASLDPGSGVTQDFTSSVVYTVTAADGTNQDWVVTVTEKSLGLDDEIQLEIYPNPTSDYLQVVSQQTISVTVMDLKGQILKRDYGKHLKLDVQSLSHGTYLLVINNGGQQRVERFIKTN